MMTAGRLFQMTGPATAKLLIPSVVVVLGTNSDPVTADRLCRLLAIAEIARQSSAKYMCMYVPIHVGTCKLSWPACT